MVLWVGAGVVSGGSPGVGCGVVSGGVGRGGVVMGGDVWGGTGGVVSGGAGWGDVIGGDVSGPDGCGDVIGGDVSGAGVVPVGVAGSVPSDPDMATATSGVPITNAPAASPATTHFRVRIPLPRSGATATR